jgi:7,8-dihydropterin-6-yl-methyl-4-(beta-D-ribofuranosyl)aminobenzene 5'-phosphate synthase
MMKLTTLCENTSGSAGIVAEWGWSIFVQSNGINILLDTGAGFTAARNANRLGIDLKTTDKIILSHAHADHTGGLREILEQTKHPAIIAHPAVLLPKYKKASTQEPALYNGIPFAIEELEKHTSFTFSQEPVLISEDIMTTGEIPRKTGFETIESHFLVKVGKELEQDDFPDDLALICKAEKGLVIILGCAHRGMINTIQHAQQITGEKRVHTVIGGTHLFPKNDTQIEQTIRALKEIGVQHLGVSHCTGLRASMRLAEAFGDRFFFNNAGSIHTVE